MDGLDVEGPEGPGELGQLSLVIRVIHPEDAVLVGVDGDRLAMLGQVSAQRLHVGLGGLGGCEAQGHRSLVTSSMNTIRVQRGPRPSNQS